MNRPVTATKVESVTKKRTKKSPGPEVFKGQLYPTFKEEITPILLKLFKKNCTGKNKSNLFYEFTMTGKEKIQMPKKKKKRENLRLYH